MASKILDSLQTDLPTRSYRVTNGFNDSLYLAANEPSLGLYRIQEHVQNSVPKTVEQRQSLQELCQRVNGACYDLEYDSQALKEMATVKQFPSVADKIDRAIHLKKQLDESERKGKGKSPGDAHRTNYGSTNVGEPLRHNVTSINSTNSEQLTDLKPRSFD